jgi:hypothetical protein
MTVFNLLVSMVFFSAPFGAIDSAKSAGVAAGGYVMAVTVGLAIGACCAYAMFKQGQFVWTSGSKLKSPVLQRWYFRALYLSVLPWMFIGETLGKWVTSVLLGLLA